MHLKDRRIAYIVRGLVRVSNFVDYFLVMAERKPKLPVPESKWFRGYKLGSFQFPESQTDTPPPPHHNLS
jgi:hypothetical protein